MQDVYVGLFILIQNRGSLVFSDNLLIGTFISVFFPVIYQNVTFVDCGHEGTFFHPKNKKQTKKLTFLYVHVLHNSVFTVSDCEKNSSVS